MNPLARILAIVLILAAIAVVVAVPCGSAS